MENISQQNREQIIKLQGKIDLLNQEITSIKEIEGILHNLALDIEFGIKKNKDVVIFQVRPIAANQRYSNNVDEKISIRGYVSKKTLLTSS